MQVSLVDWIVIFAHFALGLGCGFLFYYDRRASGNLVKFVVIGRDTTWRPAGAWLNSVFDKNQARLANAVALQVRAATVCR